MIRFISFSNKNKIVGILLILFVELFYLSAEDKVTNKIYLTIREGIQLINQKNINEALTIFHNTLNDSIEHNYAKGTGYSYYYLAFVTAPSDVDKSKDYVLAALNIAFKIDDKTLEALSYNLLGKYYLHVQEYTNAEKSLKEALNILGTLELANVELDALLSLFVNNSQLKNDTLTTLHKISRLKNDDQQALKYSDEISKEKIIEEIRLLLEAATLLIEKEQLSDAQAKLTKAQELSNKNGSLEYINRTKSIFGNLYLRKEEYYKAIELYSEALTYFQDKESFRMEKGAIISQLGVSYEGLGQYLKAEANYIASLKIFEDINNIDGLCADNCFLGELYKDNDEYAKAVTYLNSALYYAKLRGDEEFEKNLCISLAECNYKMGNIAQAEKEIESALNYYSSTPNGPKKYNAYINAGRLLISIGKETMALDYFLLAKKIAEEMGDKDAIDTVYLDLSSYYLSMGDYLKAIDYGNKLFSSKRALGPSSININISLLYAEINSIRGDSNTALSSLEIALKMSKKIGSAILEVRCLSALGDHHVKQLEYEKAIDSFLEALKIVDNQNSPKSRYAHLYDRLAYSYHELKIYPAAYGYIKKSLNINASLRNQRSLEWEYYLLGLIELTYDRKAEAYSAFKKSIEIKDNLRIQIKEKEYKSYFTEYNSTPTIEEIISLLVEMAQESNYIERIREAFFYAEDGKARSLIDMLVEGKGNINIRTSVPKEMQSKLYMLYEKIEILDKQYDMSNDKNEKRKYLKEIVSTEENIRKLELEIKNTDKKYAAVYYPRPIEIERVQNEILKDNQTGLLEYYLGRRYSFLFIVTKKAVSIVRLNKSNIEYSTDIIKLRSNIENINSIAAVLDENSFDYNLSNRLFNDLVKPAIPYFESINKIIIIPHGCLNYLPFEILITDGDNKNYLLEKYAISYAPSVSILDPSLYIRNTDQNYRGQLLILANPKYESELLTEQKGKGSNLLLPSKIRNKINNLQYSENEANNISRLFEKSTVLTGTSATKINFLEESSYYPVIHLATHGFINEDKPLYSSIVFSYNKEINDVELLPAYEAFNLKLNCDLLVLSACQTGLGQEIKYLGGEGVTGLSQAFLYAGAKSIVMSLWEVEDESTSILMSEFYSNMIEKGMDKVRALQSAKITLMKKDKRVGNINFPYYHPFFWGPFIITGIDN